MKHIKLVVAIASMIAGTAYAGAPVAPTTAPKTAAPTTAAPTAAPVVTSAKSDASMAEGEVRKIDKDAKKITLKHGEIKNLDMPGMSMVFMVDDVAILKDIKTGDKVKFTADKKNGVIFVTAIQPVAK